LKRAGKPRPYAFFAGTRARFIHDAHSDIITVAMDDDMGVGYFLRVCFFVTLVFVAGL
jgi:hypothetical protein